MTLQTSTRTAIILILTGLLILLTCNANQGPIYSARAQGVRDTIPVVSTKEKPVPLITDSTVLKTSLRQLNISAEKLKDRMTARQYEIFLAGMQSVVNDIIEENREKKQK